MRLPLQKRLRCILAATYKRVSLKKIQSTLSNSNPYNSKIYYFERSFSVPSNFLTISHGKTCTTRTSIIRTFTNPNTFCWSPHRKVLYNSNFLWIEKYITRILVITVHWFFVIHVLIYLHNFLSRYDNFTRDM